MFGPSYCHVTAGAAHHAFHAVWQQQHDAILPDPLGLTGTDELVDDALGCVVEVSKLSLPQDESIWTCHCKPQLESCGSEGFLIILSIRVLLKIRMRVRLTQDAVL